MTGAAGASDPVRRDWLARAVQTTVRAAGRPGLRVGGGRLLASGVLSLLTLALVWQAFVQPVHRSDLRVFLRAGWQVLHGSNPYTLPTDPFLWHGSAYVYPYLTAFGFVPFALLSHATADLLWFVISGGALVGGLRVLGLDRPVVIPVFLLSAPVIRSFQVGALNAVLFCVGALVWRYRHRAAAVAAGVTILVGSKLFLAPLLLWVVLTRSRHTLLLTLLATGGFLTVSFVVGPIGPGTFIRSMNLLALHEGLQGVSVYHLARALLPSAPARVVPMALAAAVLGGATLVARHRPADRDRWLFAASVVAALIATPIYWTHYTVLVGLALLVLRPRSSTVVWFTLASWCLFRPARAITALQVSLHTRGLLLSALLALTLALTLRATNHRRPASNVAS